MVIESTTFKDGNDPDDAFVSVDSKAVTVMALEEAGPDLGNEGAVGRRPKAEGSKRT